MGYIYHIYAKDEPNTMYIGQASANETHEVRTGESVAGNRVLQHFSGLYDNHHENEAFMSWLKRNPLRDVIVEIYDASSNYGIQLQYYKQFFNMWQPKGDVAFPLQIEVVDKNITSGQTQNVEAAAASDDKKWNYVQGRLLDAAEILHIYYYRQVLGYRLLNTQMGGSTYWISGDGRILNREMGVESMLNMVNHDPQVASKLQKSFNDAWVSFWNNADNKTKLQDALFDCFLDLAIESDGDKKKFLSNAKSVEPKILTVVGEMLWKELPTIQNTLQKRFENTPYTVKVNTLTKGIHKEAQELINLSAHWNIVRMIVNTLKNADAVYEYSRMLNGYRDAGKKLGDTVKKNLRETVQSELEKAHQTVLNFKVSFSNFFNIAVTGNQNLPLNHLINNSGFTIHGADPAVTAKYQTSLKHISYAYFAKVAKEVLASNKVSFTGLVYDLDGEYYGRVASYPSVSFKIEEALKTKAEIFKDEEFTYLYVRQFLTIFTRYRGSPQLGNFSSLKNTKQTGWVGLFDFPLTNAGMVGSFALGSVYPAVPFSDRTGEEIKYWRDKAVSEAKYY